MPNQSQQTLLALAELDRQILVYVGRKREMELQVENQGRAIADERKRASALQSALAHHTAHQQENEAKIRDEERKIVERRKQLTALGGAKAAKMVEREIDISTKSMQALEERMMKSMEELESTKTTLGSVHTRLEELERSFEENRPGFESALAEVEQRMSDLKNEKQSLLGGLDPTLLRLYERVRTRYSGDPIAIANNGSCEGCFRSLPTNLFHQVLGGSLGVQCPGCSRILVPGEQKPAE